MQIDLFSFFMGIILASAIFVLIDRILPFFGGNSRTRSLKRRVKELETAIKKKDAYIQKSIEELKKQHRWEAKRDQTS